MLHCKCGWHANAAGIVQINTPIEVDPVLDLTPYFTSMAQKSSTQLTYRLVGKVVHVGSLHAGHYTAECSSAVNSQLFTCDDSRILIHDASSSTPSRDASLIFYRRQD